MRKIEDFLSYLSSLDIKLWAEGERLRYNAPENTMTPDLLNQLKERKTEILDFLKIMNLGSDDSPDALRPVERNGKIPLSFAQQRLLFLYQLEKDGTAYNIPSCLRFTGQLNVSALEQSFNEVIRRHEVLRTTFVSTAERVLNPFYDDISVQLIAPSLTMTLPVIDLQHLSESEKSAQMRRYAAEDVQRPFDLERGPALRGILLRLNREEYIFLISMHHIVTDGWSMGIFVRELTAFYEAFSKGHAAALPELPIQYADFACWQLERAKGKEWQQQLDYWKKQLAGAPPVLELPADRPRPSEMSYRGSTETFEIAHDLTKQLNALSQKSGTTLFMTLFAAFATLLYRYTAQEDILIGSPIANRNRKEIEPLIGFFVNTLLLRADLSGNPPFSKLLERIRQTTLDAYAHQDIPFEKLVEVLQPERNLSHSPLFQVMFILQNAPMTKLQLPDLIIYPIKTETLASQFDLTFSLTETEYGLTGTAEYSTDLFDKDTIRRMIAHFRMLLEGIAANPEQRVSELPLLSESERHQLLVEFNETDRDYPRDKTVVDLFEEQVGKTPDNIAVIFEDTKLTYRELNERANRIAHFLRDNYDIQPDDRVGILVDCSEWMILGIIGTLKAGGAYVPVDPVYPKERINYILQDSDCKILLTEEKHYNISDEKVCPLIINLRDIPLSENSNPLSHAASHHLAYIIYTSGSTGYPKGVMIEHGSIVNTLRWRSEFYLFGEKDCVLQIPSYAFDSSVEDIFTPLISGSKLILIPQDKKHDIRYLKYIISTSNINHFLITPAFYRMLLIEASDALTHLHFVTVAGESIDEKLVSLHFDRLKDVKLYSEYGPTENSVCATVYEFDRITRQVSLGKPIWNNRIYIFSRKTDLSPIGVTGEICIAGTGLARGYLNKEQLTTDKFTDNPLIAGERIYRTGDVGCWQPDGTIKFLGRNDDQMKIRGYRIELGEIENRLLSHEAVKEAAVIARGMCGHKELAAYFVSDEAELNTGVLREFLKQSLPDYMIPSYFVHLERLPLMPNGKIDRKALPALFKAGTGSGTEYLAPRNEAEQKLAEIWHEILGIEKAGVRDNFFELGGHSLKATQMVSRIYKEMNIEIALREIFSRPTVAELAKLIRSKDPSAYIPIEKVPDAEHYPLSNAQRRLWVLSQIDADSAAYNMPGAVVLEGKTDRDALQRTFAEMIRRHESLRTSLAVTYGEPRQKVHADTDFQIFYRDISGESHPEERAADIAREDALRPFDLGKVPLFRISLLKVFKNRHIMLFNMHHIISDEWSSGIMVREFSMLYNAFCQGKTSPLQPLAIQYRDYAVWQNRLLESDEIAVHRDYWHKKLSGEIPVLNLPTDYPRPRMQTFNGETIYFELGPGEAEKLRSLGTEQNASFFMVLVAAAKVLLYRYTDQQDIIVGIPVAGRNRADLEDQIGFYVNTLALRDQIRGDIGFVSLLQEIRQNAAEAYSHQIYPFDILVDELKLRRDVSRSPLFDVMLVFRNYDEAVISLEGIEISPFEYDYRISKFDLSFDFAETKDGLRIGVEYNTDLFRPDRIHRMTQHFRELVNSILTDADQPVSHLNILPEKERSQLLAEFNDTDRDYPRDKTVVDLFEEQVEKTPDNIAVIFEDTQLTYSELNERTNRIAHFLREKYDIQPDDRVGLLAERSEWIVVGILGILKSGGAYVPMEPEYPEERIRHIITDSSCKVVLVSGNQKITCERFGVEFVNISDIGSDAPGTSHPSPLTSHLAYVIYTSGSTGVPKGVLIEHGSLYDYVMTFTEEFRVTSDDRVLQQTTVTFDASVEEIYPTLCSGATLVISPNPKELDTLFADAVRHRITILSLSPSAAGYFNTRADELHDLRAMTIGGDVLYPSHIDRLFGKILLYNGYGPTESTVCATYCKIMSQGEFIPIGKPIANRRIYILDAALNPVPLGVFGEICIAGAGTARGYLNREELSKEKFIPNPFTAGERLYRTGDVGRWLVDGNIEFVGRNDSQVKIRGYRIELGEIESRLLSNEAVKEAAVITRDDGDSKELAAYFVSDDAELNAVILREYLKQTLPDYMIPSYFVRLEKLPLMPNGKIDRKALPALFKAGTDSGTEEYLAPRNETEQKLAEIWQEILEVERIGIRDNFFNLGGHSLKMVRMISQIHHKMGLEIALREVFAHPTIEKLSEQIRSKNVSDRRQVILKEEAVLNLPAHFSFLISHFKSFFSPARRDLSEAFC